MVNDSFRLDDSDQNPGKVGRQSHRIEEYRGTRRDVFTQKLTFPPTSGSRNSFFGYWTYGIELSQELCIVFSVDLLLVLCRALFFLCLSFCLNFSKFVFAFFSYFYSLLHVQSALVMSQLNQNEECRLVPNLSLTYLCRKSQRLSEIVVKLAWTALPFFDISAIRQFLRGFFLMFLFFRMIQKGRKLSQKRDKKDTKDVSSILYFLWDKPYDLINDSQ